MSSSARAVFLGRPPGIFLLMKWITCSLTGAVPTVAGGACRLLAGQPRAAPRLARRCALKPTSTMASAQLDGLRAGGVEHEHGRRAAGRKLFLPILRSRLRMFMDTSPKSIFTGQGDRHLWHTVQWSATSSNSSQCLMLTRPARLLLVQEGLDQQRGGQDLVARAVQQVGARHVGGAHRLALAAAQAVLDAVGNGADVALLHDQRLVPHQAEAGRVGIGQIGQVINAGALRAL
jgi:hypothetical protein